MKKRGLSSRCICFVTRLFRQLWAYIRWHHLECFFAVFLVTIIVGIPVLIFSFLDPYMKPLLIVLGCISILDIAIAYQSCFLRLKRVVFVGLFEFGICLILIPALEATHDAFYQRSLIIRNFIDAFHAWYESFLRFHPELLKYSKFLAPLGVALQLWSATSIKPAKSEWNPIMSFKLHIGTTSTFIIIVFACFFTSYTLYLHTFYYPLISFCFAITTICLCLYSCFQIIIIPNDRLELKISHYLFSLIKLPLTYEELPKCSIKKCELFVHELKAVLGYRAASSRSRKGSLVRVMLEKLKSIKKKSTVENDESEKMLRTICFIIGLCWAHLEDLGEGKYEDYLIRMSSVWAKYEMISTQSKYDRALQFGLICGELLTSINVNQENRTVEHIEKMIKKFDYNKAYMPSAIFEEIQKRYNESPAKIRFLLGHVDKASERDAMYLEAYKNIVNYFDSE